MRATFKSTRQSASMVKDTSCLHHTPGSQITSDSDSVRTLSASSGCTCWSNSHRNSAVPPYIARKLAKGSKYKVCPCIKQKVCSIMPNTLAATTTVHSGSTTPTVAYATLVHSDHSTDSNKDAVSPVNSATITVTLSIDTEGGDSAAEFTQAGATNTPPNSSPLTGIDLLLPNEQGLDTSAYSIPSLSSDTPTSSFPLSRSRPAKPLPSRVRATPFVVNPQATDAGPGPSSSSNSINYGHKIQTRRIAKESLRPLGPRHLEYEYDIAYKAYKEAIYLSLHLVGYYPLKGVARNTKGKDKDRDSAAVIIPKGAKLDNNALQTLKSIPSVARAAKRLDDADRALEEALERGEKWDNTEVPEEMCWGSATLKGLEYMRIPPVNAANVSDLESNRTALEVQTRRTRSQVAAAGKRSSPLVSAPDSTTTKDVATVPLYVQTTPPFESGQVHEGDRDAEMANPDSADKGTECSPSPTTSNTESSGSTYVEPSPGANTRRKRKTPETTPETDLETTNEKKEERRSKRLRRAPKRMA